MLLLHMNLQLIRLEPLKALRALLSCFLLYYRRFNFHWVLSNLVVILLVHFICVVYQHVLIFEGFGAQRAFQRVELL